MHDHSVAAPSYAFRHDLSLQIVGAFDLGGVLYHARYLELLEETRAAFFQAHHCSYRSLMDAGYHVVVTQTAQRFLAPIYYGQPVAIQMWCTDLRHGMFVLDYSVHTWPAPKSSDRRDMNGSSSDPRTEEDHPLTLTIETSRRVHTATTWLAFVKRQSDNPDDPRYTLSRIPEPVAAALRTLVDNTAR